jgi:hypothetical protein
MEGRGKKMGEMGNKPRKGEVCIRGNEMQNRVELRQKGHERIIKTTCHDKGEKYNFLIFRGGGE